MAAAVEPGQRLGPAGEDVAAVAHPAGHHRPAQAGLLLQLPQPGTELGNLNAREAALGARSHPAAICERCPLEIHRGTLLIERPPSVDEN